MLFFYYRYNPNFLRIAFGIASLCTMIATVYKRQKGSDI